MISEFCSNLVKKVLKNGVVSNTLIPSRIQLVPASGILSSYPKKNNPSERWDISVFKDNALICSDMFTALCELDKQVTAAGGTLYVTDLRRTWAMQAQARQDYVSGVKKAYAAVPGGSFHQAARAIDFAVSQLNFKGVAKDQWLKKFWDLAKPLGFHPIIAIPDLNMSECWHFDFPGKDWEAAYAYKDKSSSDAIDYTLVAKCCILDAGLWDPSENPDKVVKMFIQAQLIRLGRYEIGSVDGILGSKSLKALQDLGLTATDVNQVAQSLSKM